MITCLAISILVFWTVLHEFSFFFHLLIWLLVKFNDPMYIVNGLLPGSLIAGAFLATVAGISTFIGFSATLSSAKKTDPKYFSKGLHGGAELADAGVILALRALGWGSLYAIMGTTCLCYGIWKFSGAKDLKDFRLRMGNMLPVLPKNNPPQSRTEFSGMNDLMTYLSEEYGKKSVKDK